MNDTVHFEKTLSSETLFEGRVITLTKDTALLENGKTATREVVHHHGGACILPYFADGTICMVRQFRYAMGEVLTEIPAGKLDYIGEDPASAALRELREETGVEPIDENSCDIDHVGQFYSSEGMTDELANIMVVHLRHWQAVERHFDADEHVESAWIPWKQLRDTHITASNSEIAILHEQIRRIRQQ